MFGVGRSRVEVPSPSRRAVSGSERSEPVGGRRIGEISVPSPLRSAAGERVRVRGSAPVRAPRSRSTGPPHPDPLLHADVEEREKEELLPRLFFPATLSSSVLHADVEEREKEELLPRLSSRYSFFVFSAGNDLPGPFLLG